MNTSSLPDWLPGIAGGRQVMPDDHSEVEPLLPIPNRTVKRFSADDSEQLARESRTSSGKPLKTLGLTAGGFVFGAAPAGVWLLS